MLAELRVEPRGECLARYLIAVLQRDERLRALAAIGVGDAEYDRFLDRGMLVQMRLDHAGIDLEAADRAHVLQPVDDADIALRVDRRDVAGAQPRSDERRVGKACVSTGRSRWS